ncbi:MAG: PaaI family thioesterase [Myxococcota bacterium]|nr:PaaI family thioesterase [Myxococcota bacterium]
MFSREDILTAMEAFPLHKQLGFRIHSAAEGACEARCTIGAAHLNFGGVVHGGVMYLLLDVTAYCAAVTLLPDNTNATTHDIHVSMMRPTPPGAELHLRAVVKKAGRSLYFIDVEATVEGRPVASARVTKSLVSLS